MANFFSDWYAASSAAADTGSILEPPKIAPIGTGHSRIRYARGEVTVGDTALGDVLRFFHLKSGDRLLELLISVNAGWSASNSAELGLFTYQDDRAGAVLDVDLFGAAIDMSTAALDRTDCFALGAAAGVDRGKTLWELYALGAGGDTSDPKVVYQFGVTLNGNDDATSSTAVLEAYYVSGD